MASSTSAFAVTTLVVNTPHDAVADPLDLPASWDIDKVVSSGDAKKVDPAVASCLGTHYDDSSGGSGIRPTLRGQEEEANEKLAAALSNPDDTDGPVEVTRPCSLRMALHLAAAMRASVNGVGDGEVLITFDLRGEGDTVDVVGDRSVEDDIVPLPPLVDPIGTSSALAPEKKITIDGCKGSTTNQPRPCVNVRLPNVLRNTPLPATALERAKGAGIVVGGPRVTIRNIAFLGGSPAIMTLPSAITPAEDPRRGETGNSLKVESSYFGMNRNGDLVEDGEPGVAIQLLGHEATIGGETNQKRNVFAAGDVGVHVTGNGNRVQGNWFGVDDDGNLSEDASLGTAVRVTGARVAPDRLDDVLVGLANSAAQTDAGNPVPDRTAPETVGTQPLGTKNLIGGPRGGDPRRSCDAPCNLIASTAGLAIDVGGSALRTSTSADVEGDPLAPKETTIQGNWLGVRPNGRAGSVGADAGAAIAVRNDALQTTIGGGASEGNLIVNAGGAGVHVADDAGRGTRIDRNFVDFGFTNLDLLIDLGGDYDDEDEVSPDGPGNPAGGPSGGVQAPTITQAVPTAVRGTAAPDSTVHVYLVPGWGAHSSGHGDAAAFVGETDAGNDGRWSLEGTDLPVGALRLGDKVTATANAGDRGTSELALNALVVPAPQVASTSRQDPPPAPPPPAPPPSPDRNAPAVVSVFGKPVPANPSKAVTTRLPTALSGRAQDASGVARVDVALSLPAGRSAARRRTSRRRACSFVDFRRARFVRRDCAKPLFARARGTGAWRLPVNRKVRRILRRGRTYVLHVRATDRLGNVATRTLLIRFR